MRRLLTGVASWLLLIMGMAVVPEAGAAQLKAYVEPFKVVGAADAEMSGTLQTLLMSRLTNQAILVQETAGGAQALVKGSYIQLGKVFSIDVTVRDQSGGILGRAFEQGERQEDVLPAMTKVAEKLQGLLQPDRSVASVPVQQETPAIPVPKAAGKTDVIRTETVGRSTSGGMVSQRMPGVYSGIAPLRSIDGGREVYLLRERSLHVVRQDIKGEELAKAEFGRDDKAIALDSADLDGDGIPEAYVTILQGEEVASQVWVYKDNKLVRVAQKLPYFFRVLGPWNARQLYAQEMGRLEDFYGPVLQVKRGNSGYEFVSPVKLPKFAHIFNFNRFRDREGNDRFVVIHPDGYLMVFSEAGEELWRSNDKYGGSEVYFTRDDQERMRFTGSAVRKIFTEQRLIVTGRGEIVVPANSGWVIGTSRNYSKNTIYGFTWNGVTLEEQWHTNASQNYLADFFYDETRKELVMLEIVKKAVPGEEGATAIYLKKVE